MGVAFMAILGIIQETGIGDQCTGVRCMVRDVMWVGDRCMVPLGDIRLIVAHIPMVVLIVGKG